MIEKKSQRRRNATVDMQLSTFHIPPSGDALVLAKRCPIGPKAAKRMLDTVSPGQFELIEMEDDLIEGILVKKELFLRADRGLLIDAIVQEAKAIMGPQCMITIRCEITVTVRREIEAQSVK